MSFRDEELEDYRAVEASNYWEEEIARVQFEDVSDGQIIKHANEFDEYNDFVKSVTAFHEKRGYITEKQRHALIGCIIHSPEWSEWYLGLEYGDHIKYSDDSRREFMQIHTIRAYLEDDEVKKAIDTLLDMGITPYEFKQVYNYYINQDLDSI